MTRRDWTLRLLLAGVLGWSLLLPHGAAAQRFGCSASRGDPWFVEALAFDAVTLAPGVMVEPITSNTSEQLVQLSNSSATPLYLVELDRLMHDAYAPAAPIGLDDHLFVSSQIVSDTVLLWSPDHEQTKEQWQTQAGISQILIPLDNVLTDYSDFQLYGDQRPLTVTVPLPRTLSVYVIYGTRLVRIPVRRTYTLNPSYNPTRTHDEQAACAEQSSRFGFAVIGTLGMLLVLAAIAGLVFVGLIVWFVRLGLKLFSKLKS